MIECLSEEAECFLATMSAQVGDDAFYKNVRTAPLAEPSNIRGLSAIRLSVSTRTVSPDIVHIVGTNVLAFAPAFKLLRGHAKIVRHVFTSYDSGDRAVRPLRWLANSLFIESYAFTTPRIGEWAEENSPGTRRFLIRPPIDCELYRPVSHERQGIYEGLRGKVVLYMGPLWGTRFPAVQVLAGIGHLSKMGVDARLVVLTSAKRSSESDVKRLLAMGHDMGLGDRLTVRRVDLTEEQRVEAYNLADVVIFPYVGPVPERLADPPFGILEAMACGGIVVATDVLSVTEVIADGVNGFVARDSSPVEIARGIQRALTTDEEQEIREEARQRILADFAYPKVRDTLMSSYLSLMG